MRWLPVPMLQLACLHFSKTRLPASAYRFTCLHVEFHRGTSLLQVWRGALLLADLLLSQPQLVAARTVAELGAGCGLASVAAACSGARRVLSTDLPPLLRQLQVRSPDTRPCSSWCGCDWA